MQDHKGSRIPFGFKKIHRKTTIFLLWMRICMPVLSKDEKHSDGGGYFRWEVGKYYREKVSVLHRESNYEYPSHLLMHRF